MFGLGYKNFLLVVYKVSASGQNSKCLVWVTQTFFVSSHDTVVSLILVGINFRGLEENEMLVDFLYHCFDIC
jgi:hypothetical protein